MKIIDIYCSDDELSVKSGFDKQAFKFILLIPLPHLKTLFSNKSDPHGVFSQPDSCCFGRTDRR